MKAVTIHSGSLHFTAALELIKSSDLVMDTDKIINRQLDSIAVSVNCGFRKLTADAVHTLKITG